MLLRSFSEKDRFGYTPWTHKQIKVALKVNAYFVPYEFQWIGDKRFYDLMCSRCKSHHEDFVYNSLRYIKGWMIHDCDIYPKERYMWGCCDLPHKKPVYRFCKNRCCILYAKKHILQASVLGRTSMKYLYNHVCLYSKVIDELKEQTICEYPGEVFWYKIKDCPVVLFKQRFLEHAKFIYELAFRRDHPKFLFKAHKRHWKRLLKFKKPALRLNKTKHTN